MCQQALAVFLSTMQQLQVPDEQPCCAALQLCVVVVNAGSEPRHH